jgi:hypothetical protein
MARKNIPSVKFALLMLLTAAIAAAQQPAANPPAPAQAPAVQNGKVEGIVVKSGGGPPVKTATVSLQRVDSTSRLNGVNGTNPLAALNLGAAGQNGLGALLGGLAGANLSGATDNKGQFSIANVPPVNIASRLMAMDLYIRSSDRKHSTDGERLLPLRRANTVECRFSTDSGFHH